MPDIIIVGGPNGAGKSTFIRRFLPTRRQMFRVLNADDIERELRGQAVDDAKRPVLAARLMLSRLEEAIRIGQDLMIETTLATRNYAARIPEWRRTNYRIALIYLKLATVELSIERVRRRVLAGGHGIPEDIIRRRFHKSLRYLNDLYKPIADEWYVWESIEGDFIPAEAWDMA